MALEESSRAAVAIVGGGAVGSAIAYFLTADPDFTGRCVVVERDPTYETASTTLSCASIRQQFSTPENVAIGLFGADFLRRMPDLLEVDGDRPDPQFRENGYLFLAGAEGVPILEDNNRIQRAGGADITLLSADDLKARYPWMNTDDLAGASLGMANEGWFDPSLVLNAFKRKARDQGAEYIKAEARLLRKGARVVGVRLGSGETILADTVVNAAGPHAGALCRAADIDLPVEPRTRTVFVLKCREKLNPPPPLTIDHTGVYLRPEGDAFLSGVNPPADREPETSALEPDWSLFEDIIWPSLANRIPAFESLKLERAWAGHYDMNPVDHNGILGPHPEAPGLMLANGFSGHGLQQSPAVGRAISELILSGGYRTLDLSRFAYDRFARGDLILERNVV
ncbi:MAG: FAD-binding oxidoreductase [Alphaproteobacteria bacterium]|nr:FAD-binding oxidoreductase [Alphaproteobacteria bacterium]